MSTPASPLPAEYPFQLKSFAHPPTGYRQSYLDEGSGPAVVMVHGNPTWSYYYRNLVRTLETDHRCLVPDHLGCGYSDKPAGAEYRLRHHIENLERLIHHWEVDQFDLVVHDWGGPIGLGAALARPERLRRVVILNTAAFRSQDIPLRINICRTPLLGELMVRGLNAFAWPATRMAATRPLPAPVRRGYLQPYDNWAHRIAIARFVQDIPLSPKHPSYPDLLRVEKCLELLRDKPMKILWGGRDFCFHRGFFEEWTRRFPKADARLLEDAGHYVLEDGGDLVLQEIAAFLED